MEFSEKLQNLRKSRGMTQEELADVLFVSRTAISKWELGKGYPSIDSLKHISSYFSVSIDDLLSSEKIIDIARNESRLEKQKICHMLFGMTDILSLLLLFIPLYPKTIDNYVYAVNLFMYTEIAREVRYIYLILFLLLTFVGFVKVLSVYVSKFNDHQLCTILSIFLSVISVFLLAFTKETYALTMIFIFLLIKVGLLFKCS